MDADDAGIARLRALLARPEAEVDLARAALLVAELEQPGLDPCPALRALDDLATGLRRCLAREPDAAAALARFLGQECGFAGSLERYYDPANSCLNLALERRSGLPITLSVIYIEVGRRAGLTVHGIGFPAHFIVGVGPPGQRRYLDPFRRGRELTRADLAEQVRQTFGGAARLSRAMLQPADTSAIIVRMLHNLRQAHLLRQSLAGALAATEWLSALQPEQARHRRDRAVLLYHLGRWAAARSALATYLDGQPDGPDASMLRGLLDTAELLLASRN